jgi:hypothetical protein
MLPPLFGWIAVERDWRIADRRRPAAHESMGEGLVTIFHSRFGYLPALNLLNSFS